MAPSGSGKGRDILIPALIEYEGSTVVIDPKGQLCAVCGPRLAERGKRVAVLNPFNILPGAIGALPHVGFNPLAVLNPEADSFGADCDALAEAIVLHEGTGTDTHWTDSARQLVSGVMMELFVAPAANKEPSSSSIKLSPALTSSRKRGRLTIPGI